MSFTINHFPTGYTLDFDPFLYNSPDYLLLQPGNKRVDFYMLDHKKKKITGRVSFFIAERAVYSPINSPFGSFELSIRLSLEKVLHFTSFVIDHLTEIGTKKIIIKNYAQVYAPEQSAKLAVALNDHGFSITPVINHHISIDKETFEDKIHKMEQRKLKKCLASGYQFKEEPYVALPAIYAFIHQCRKEKGQPLNISLAHLQKSMEALPGWFKIFSVKKDNALIAATITVAVSQTIAYNFLPASLSGYNPTSPMVYLLSKLYESCQSSGIKILDLGISTTEDHHQFSLMRFKAHIGAETALKFTFSKG